MKLAWLASSVIVLAWVRPADACGVILSTPALRGVPVAGQTDVPTDVVPAYDASALREFSVQVTLRTLSGAAVAFTQELASGYVELHPATPLLPNTVYVVEARPPFEGSNAEPLALSFSTGPGPLAAAPAALEFASMQYWWSENGANTAACDFWSTGACVAIPAGELVEVSFVSDEAEAPVANLPLYRDQPFELGLSYEELSAGTTCLQLRRRALNGLLGEPTAVCAADLPTVELLQDTRPSCTETGVAPDAGGSIALAELKDWSVVDTVSPDHSHGPYQDLGCALEAPRSPTVATPLSLLALAAVLVRRRPTTAR